MHNSILLIGHLYLDGIRVVCGKVWLQKQIPKDTCIIKIGLHVQTMITILGSIVNIIGGDLYDQ